MVCSRLLAPASALECHWCSCRIGCLCTYHHFPAHHSLACWEAQLMTTLCKLRASYAVSESASAEHQTSFQQNFEALNF